MEKFSEIVYKRPDMDALSKKIQTFVEDFLNAADYSEARALFLGLNEELRHFDTAVTIASIRNTVDTSDEFYEKEMDFFNSALPKAELEIKAANETLLKSAFIKDFEDEFGSLYIRNLRSRLRFADERNLENQIKENQLVQKYSKAAAVCSTTFRGETVNFYGLLKYMQSTDRSVRKEAFEAWADLYASISGELDDIYSQLVEIRCDMAETLGFSDYIEMAYENMGRYDYDRKNVENFRNQIVDVIVPVCTRLYEMQKERLGIDKIHYYDEALTFPEGNAVPIGTTRELVEKARTMYHELSKETAEFFDFMVEYELFDLETKPAKHQGGYCTSLADYNAPFIFSNFNKTSADVDVLTHEAGHAFEAYTASRIYPLTDQVWSTSEVNEIHSMSMEFFTYPWMELFFGENTDKYRFAHLADAVTVIPYMACVDEFQHRVFEGRVVDAMERRRIWRDLEKKYMPWRDYDGNEFLENGGFWMQKQHIFMYPFYYIDYALAQMGAFEFYGRMKEDKQTAWDDYYRLCCAGGSRGYFELLKIAHLNNPFEDGTIQKVMDKILPDLF